MGNNVLSNFATTMSDDSMDMLISYYEQDDTPFNDIVELVKVLAFSGESYPYSPRRLDIPSTVGPSSLTTLLCPLYLDGFGVDIVKLGIPGRPAGAIDSLAQINNYKIDYSKTELAQEIDKGGYIHFLANRSFTPADATLYAYRKQKGKVAVPNIAIASLLSKIVAMGLSTVGLDIRVSSSGNFGHNYGQAVSNAKLFCKVAKAFDIKAVCFISDSSVPYQPYLGRGESLLALYKIFSGTSTHWLNQHEAYCKNISKLLMHFGFSEESELGVNDSSIEKAFEKNVIRQKGDMSSFIEYCHTIQRNHSINLVAETNGYCYYDLNRIRQIIVQIQTLEVKSDNSFPDPCGMILNVESGAYVDKGDLIATIRIASNLYKNLMTNSIVLQPLITHR